MWDFSMHIVVLKSQEANLELKQSEMFQFEENSYFEDILQETNSTFTLEMLSKQLSAGSEHSKWCRLYVVCGL